MDNQDNSQNNLNTTHGIIMKELSDIKSSLAVNTNETANIKASMTHIKTDIKEIKNDFVSRREFDEGLRSFSELISPLQKMVYGVIAIVSTAIVGAILNVVLKK